MSMANAIQIKYRGEVLCCLDQTEVKAVEPYVYRKYPPQNILKRVYCWTRAFVIGKQPERRECEYEECTKVSFKDGTWIRLKMPFMEFVNAYC